MTSIFIKGPFVDQEAEGKALAKEYGAKCKGGARGSWIELAFATKGQATSALQKIGARAQSAAAFKAPRVQAHHEFLVRSKGVEGARAYAIKHDLKSTLAYLSKIQ